MKSNALYLGEKHEPRTVANGMSVYTYPYRWRSWRGFWGNIKAWFDNKGAAKQRAKQGYCVGDVWNAGNSIVDYIINVLCEYRNRTIAWPDQYFTTFDEWVAYIDEIIDLLDYSRQDADELIDFAGEFYEVLKVKHEDRTDEQNALVEKYYKAEQEIYETQCAKRKVAFAKLSAHIDQIWY
jgi:hypothetical protein